MRKRDMCKVKIEPGGLDALDPFRVAVVVMMLSQNAEKCLRMAASHGEVALRDYRNGYQASFEVEARIAWRYAELGTSYRDAMAWIMSATAHMEYALGA